MDRPRILVLSPPMAEPGGVQAYTATLVRALRSICGEETVHLLSLLSPRAAGVNSTARLSPSHKASYFWRAVREAARLRPRLTLSTHVGLAPIGHFISTILGGDAWVSAHGIEVWGKLSPVKRHALRTANKILPVSVFTRGRIIERHGVSPARAFVLPNVLDGELLTVMPDNRKLAALHLDAKRSILTVGRLAAAERYKGHDVLLRALPAVLARFPNAVYLIAGDGDDRAHLEQVARDSGVAQSVYFLGALNRAELAACYRACEIFAMPARTVLDDAAPKGEGFGISLLEAMSFARPVIGPDSGAPVEFIRQGETGLLVDPENPADVAASILQLFADPALAHELGERARALVEREYSFDTLVRRLQPLLASLE
jgi:phosphatidylinositol alpha-1,6-mannosyltransferase